jgi:hypothetical protein
MDARDTGRREARLDAALRGALELRDPGPTPARLRAAIEAATAAPPGASGRVRSRIHLLADAPRLVQLAAAVLVVVVGAATIAALRPWAMSGQAGSPTAAPTADVAQSWPGVTFGGDSVSWAAIAWGVGLGWIFLLLVLSSRLRRGLPRFATWSVAGLVGLALLAGQLWVNSLAPLGIPAVFVPGPGSFGIERVDSAPGLSGGKDVVYYAWRAGGTGWAPLYLANDGLFPIRVLGIAEQHRWAYSRFTGLTIDPSPGSSGPPDTVAVPPAVALDPGASVRAWVGLEFPTCGPGSSVTTGPDAGSVGFDYVTLRYEMLGETREQRVEFGYVIGLNVMGNCEMPDGWLDGP